MEYIKKDIFKSLEDKTIDVMMHQVNCIGAFNAGIAKLIRNKYPLVYNFYITKVRSASKFIDLYGTYQFIQIDNGYVVNLFSQYFTGEPTSNQIPQSQYNDDFFTRINMLKKTLGSVKKEIPENLTIGLPLIASGIAKSSEHKKLSDLEYFKKFIEPTIEEVLGDREVIVHYI